METGDEAGREGQRIPGVDILRGLALFGVLEVNLLTDFRVPLLSYLENFHTHAGAANEAVDWVVGLALESKFLALFSLLFGAGLALQIEARGGQPRGAVAGFVLRRCAVLLALGLVHHTLVWNGDILALYGALGLALSPLLLGPRWLVLPGAAALALVSMVFQPDWLPHGARAQAEIDEALRVYAGGDLGEILGYRLHESRALIVPLLVSVSPRVASLLLLGAWASRRGLLRGSEGSGRLLGGVALVALPLGAVGTALQAHAATFRWSLGALGGPVGYLATAGMGVGYGAALLLALRSARLRAWLSPVASLGRLSLSMYLLQSLIFVLVFQKMGQIGRHGPAPVALRGRRLRAPGGPCRGLATPLPSGPLRGAVAPPQRRPTRPRFADRATVGTLARRLCPTAREAGSPVLPAFCPASRLPAHGLRIPGRRRAFAWENPSPEAVPVLPGLDVGKALAGPGGLLAGRTAARPPTAAHCPTGADRRLSLTAG